MTRPSFLGRMLTGLAVLAGTLVVVQAPAQAAPPNRQAWVLYNQPAAAVIGYGTWPATTTVVPLSAARYQVTFTGQAASGGVVHVTAIGTAGNYCRAESWSPVGADEVVLVKCSQVGGLAAASSFSAFFASASVPSGTGLPYGYVSTTASSAITSQFSSVGATNTVINTGTGQWTVSLPGLATAGPLDGTVQVTAVNPSSAARCKVASWVSAPSGQVIQVRCFNSSGGALNTGFSLSYGYNDALFGTAYPPQRFGYVLSVPGPGPASTNFNGAPPSMGVNIVSGTAGTYPVTFPRIGVAPNTVQITAFGSSSDYCGLTQPWINLATGPDLSVNAVNCFNNAGTLTAGGFVAAATSTV